MWTSVRHQLMGICECIYCIWMECLRLCTCGHRCLHVDTCPPRYWALMFRGRSRTQTENAATNRTCCLSYALRGAIKLD